MTNQIQNERTKEDDREINRIINIKEKADKQNGSKKIENLINDAKTVETFSDLRELTERGQYLFDSDKITKAEKVLWYKSKSMKTLKERINFIANTEDCHSYHELNTFDNSAKLQAFVLPYLKDKIELEQEETIILIAKKFGYPKNAVRKSINPKPKTYLESMDIAEKIIEDNTMILIKEYRKMFLVYENGIYIEKDITRYLEKLVINYFDNKKLTSLLDITTISLIRKFIESKIEYKSVKDFDNYNNLINLEDCIIDITNLDNIKTIKHNSKYLMRIQLPIIYNSKAICPKIKKFINQVFGEYYETLIYEFIGDCLTGKVTYQKALLLVGSGSNGKSTFLYILKKLVGIDNTSEVSLHKLDKNNYASSTLENVLINMHNDLPKKPLYYVDTFKNVVAEKQIDGERKFGKQFSFKNRSKHIFACNKVPKAFDEAEGFFRRWIMVMCNFKINEKNIIPDYDEILTSKKELSGLFNLALKHLKNLRKRKHYEKKYYEETEKQWSLLSNPIQAFYNEYLILNDNLCTEQKELLKYINPFLKFNNFNPITDKKLTRDLKRLDIYSERVMEGGIYKRKYNGIILDSDKIIESEFYKEYRLEF